MAANDTNLCVDVSPVDRKAEQCFRLSTCAINYGLYDMFVYSFGDDLDFDTGAVDETIKVFDDAELRLKLARIYSLGADILVQYNDNGVLTNTTILDPLNPESRECDDQDTHACKCDLLLQEFHRYDEGLSVQGKWAGGSVTSVCKGWGTSKVQAKLTL